jgi:hypothetical protein
MRLVLFNEWVVLGFWSLYAGISAIKIDQKAPGRPRARTDAD